MIGAYSGRRTATVMPITKGTPTRSALPSTCKSQHRSSSLTTRCQYIREIVSCCRRGTDSKSKQAHYHSAHPLPSMSCCFYDAVRDTLVVQDTALPNGSTHHVFISLLKQWAHPDRMQVAFVVCGHGNFRKLVSEPD